MRAVAAIGWLLLGLVGLSGLAGGTRTATAETPFINGYDHLSWVVQIEGTVRTFAVVSERYVIGTVEGHVMGLDALSIEMALRP